MCLQPVRWASMSGLSIVSDVGFLSGPHASGFPVLVGPEVAGLGLVSCPHNGQKPIGNSGQGSWRASCCSEDRVGGFPP